MPVAPVVKLELTNASIGSVELGTVLAMLLHGTLISQYITYFRRYPKDSWGLKTAVWGTALACVAHAICISWALWDISIQVVDVNASESFAMPITFPVSLFFTAVLQFLVQLTYCYRMWKFARNWFVPIFVFLGVAYNIVGTIQFAIHFPSTSLFQSANSAPPSFFDQLKYQDGKFWLINSVFINTAVNDVVITLSMCYYLKKGREEVLKRTAKVIEKLVVWTIQTSAPTCFLGFAIVATFMNNMSNNVWIGLSILATPIYPFALLALLNGRESLSRDHTVVTDNIETMATYHTSGGRSVHLPTFVAVPPPRPGYSYP